MREEGRGKRDGGRRKREEGREMVKLTFKGPESGKKNVRNMLDKLQRYKSGLDGGMPVSGSMCPFFF